MRPANRSTRFTVPLFLLPFLFVAQVLFYQTLCFQRNSWHEDRSAPLALTSEWKPNRTYSPLIESGIAALSQSDPDKVAFLRERGMPIHIFSPTQMALSGCPAGSLGCTRHTDSSINVASAAAASPVSLAVVLSHELTHCWLHDQVLGRRVASIWYRLLWRNEEATAHVAGLRTAARLRLPLSRGPLSGWWFEYLIWYWPAATLLLSGLASGFDLHLIARYVRKYAVQRVPPPSKDQAAARTFHQPSTTPAIL